MHRLTCYNNPKKDYLNQFGFLIEALEYGAPPHGGIAFGLDRLVALMANKQAIRDFIAFPKNNSGKDIMIESPNKINLVFSVNDARF